MVRLDVENLFLLDTLPLGMDFGIYDTANGGRLQVDLSFANSVTNELRAQIVNQILQVAHSMPELDPFTVVRAHEVMANRDLVLDSLLINPEFAPLMVKAQRPWFGHTLKIFAHDEVPRGSIYGLSQPTYLGTVARSRSGLLGMAVTNDNGIIWGRFQLRRS